MWYWYIVYFLFIIIVTTIISLSVVFYIEKPKNFKRFGHEPIAPTIWGITSFITAIVGFLLYKFADLDIAGIGIIWTASLFLIVIIADISDKHSVFTQGAGPYA